MVEGARLESVCIRKGTEGSNPSLSAILFLLKGLIDVFKVGPWQIGSYAMETHEPRQVRKEAAVSDNLHVP